MSLEASLEGSESPGIKSGMTQRVAKNRSKDRENIFNRLANELILITALIIL